MRELTKREMQVLGLLHKCAGERICEAYIASVLVMFDTAAGRLVRRLRKSGHIGEGFELTDAGRKMLWPYPFGLAPGFSLLRISGVL